VLDRVTIDVVNLPAGKLGATLGHSILIDGDAAGWGWFVAPTPKDNSEFQVRLSDVAFGVAPDSMASGHMDLLSTVLHELGNAMGFPEDLGQDVTGMFLQAGTRILPGPQSTFAQPSWLDNVLNNTVQDSNRKPNAGIRLLVPNA
jgi:hypothetical protein